MVTSPYDNLPVGNSTDSTSASATQEKDSAAGAAELQENNTQETLQYVEVPLEQEQEPEQKTEKSLYKKLAAQAAESDAYIAATAQATESDAYIAAASPRSTEDETYSTAAPHAKYNTYDTYEINEQNSSARKPATRIPLADDISSEVQEKPRITLSPMKDAPQYENISINNRLSMKEYIVPFEETLLVPDSMPDMKKILFTEANIRLLHPGKTRYKKGEQISGDITLYTVYIPDSDVEVPVDVVKSTVPFRTDKYPDSPATSTFKITASVKSTSAEFLNERKFTVRGEILLRFTEITDKELPVFKECSDTRLVPLRKTATVSSLIFETDDIAEISQEINIDEACPAPERILKETISITEGHRQITAGKLVINGVIRSDILYCGTLDGRQQLSCISNKTEFTQFITINGNCSEELLRTEFTADGLRITINGEREFLLEGKVHILVYGYENKEVSMISDAYHKTCDISFDTSHHMLSSLDGVSSGEISSREIVNIDESSLKPSELLCGSGRITSMSASPENSRILLNGSVQSELLALSEDGVPFIIPAAIPIRSPLDMPENATSGDVSTEIFASIKELRFDEINSRQIEINIRISISVWVSHNEKFTVLENFSFEDCDKPQRRISMVLYTVGPEDSIWDIAKKYKSDIEMLAEINAIDADKPLPEGMKLLIAR